MLNTTSLQRRSLVAGVAAVTVAMLPFLSLRRVAVSGYSMFPGFHPGDRLLVVRWLPLRPGHVVAVRDPREPRRLLVKRVAAVGRTHLDVRGDNETASTDSRSFGPVDRAGVVGTVVYRYSPAERVGWWP